MNRRPNYFSIARNNLLRWMTNPRIYILAVLLLILLWSFLEGVLVFSKAMGYRVTPWAFPFLTNAVYVQRFMMLGLVFLFCDAPFLHEGQPYLLIRSGRVHWALGQILYIMVGTAIYFLFIAAVSALMLSPNLFASLEWGKIWGTLANTDAGQGYRVRLHIAAQIQSMYTPIQALGLSLLLQWCAGTLLGLVIFAANLCFKRALGAILASVLILFDIIIYNSMSDYVYRFSPLSMARLTMLDATGLSLRPSLAYAFAFFGAAIVLLSVLAVIFVRKREIQISPQI